MNKIVDWNESLPNDFLKYDTLNESSAKTYKDFFMDILRYQGFNIQNNSKFWNDFLDKLSDDLLYDGLNDLWCLFITKALSSNEGIDNIVNKKDIVKVSKGIKDKDYESVFYGDENTSIKIPRKYVFEGNVSIVFKRFLEEIEKREIENKYSEYFSPNTFKYMITYGLLIGSLHTYHQTFDGVKKIILATAMQQSFPVNAFEKKHYIARNLMEIIHSNLLVGVRLRNIESDSLVLANKLTNIFSTAYQQLGEVNYLKEVESISKSILSYATEKKAENSIIFPDWKIKKTLTELMDAYEQDSKIKLDIDTNASELPQIYKDFQKLYERGKVNELITESESYSIIVDMKTFTEEQEKKGITKLISVYNLKLLSSVISSLGLEYLETYVNTKKQSVNFIVSNFEKINIKKEDYQDFSKKLVNNLLENMQFNRLVSSENEEREILSRELEIRLEEFIMKYNVKNSQVIRQRILKH